MNKFHKDHPNNIGNWRDCGECVFQRAETSLGLFIKTAKSFPSDPFAPLLYAFIISLILEKKQNHHEHVAHCYHLRNTETSGRKCRVFFFNITCTWHTLHFKIKQVTDKKIINTLYIISSYYYIHVNQQMLRDLVLNRCQKCKIVSQKQVLSKYSLNWTLS